MRILVVAATDTEIAPLAARLGDGSKSGPKVQTYTQARHDIDVLTTGVGMVATAAWCARALAQGRYDLALNFGVCGSFDSNLELAQVVHVVSDRIAELGAEDDESFLTIQDLKLVDDNEFPFRCGCLVNLSPPLSATLAKLTVVNGITVNTVHGNERSITSVRRRFQPQVESMEGAAFMYACMIHGISFAQVRAVSNVVEKRNRKAWNLSGAIRNLTEVALSILEDV
jgi:futalosine hydrolase